MTVAPPQLPLVDEASLLELETSIPGIRTLRSSLEERGMPPSAWEKLMGVATERRVSPGEVLILEGEVIERKERRELFAVVEGKAQIEIRGRRVASIDVGSFAGEASFVSKTFGPRSATVRAVTDLVALSWESGKLRELLENPENSALRFALLDLWTRELAHKLHKVMNRYDVAPQEPAAAAAELNGGVGDSEGSSPNVWNAARNYGYRSIVAEEPLGKATPVTAAKLAWWTFSREYKALRRSFRFEELASNTSFIPKLFAETDKLLEDSVEWLFPKLKSLKAVALETLDPETQHLQAKLKELKLSNKAIADREQRRMANTRELLNRESSEGVALAAEIRRLSTPWFIMVPYYALCAMLDVLFDGRPIQRFWFLETVARMPYFSYQSMLHLYESLGWWTIGNDVRRVHFAEEINEAAHLLIMESLGGDASWLDRFLARHSAIVYYWMLNALFLVSPFLAYNFSELLESHAVDTYSEFVEENEELLKSLPPSEQAVKYYMSGDMYLFDSFQSARPAYSRRPVLRTLYDVFCNIRDDEFEHVRTMVACERSTKVIRSPTDVAATALWTQDIDTLVCDDEDGCEESD